MDSVEQILQHALQFHKTGNLEQAELLYRKILQTDPRHCDALYLLALIAQHAGKDDLAVERFQHVLRLRPEFADAHNNLGVSLMTLQKFAESAACFEQVIALNAGNAEAFNNLGNARKLLGQLEHAIDSYRKAIALKPDYAEAYYNLANAMLDQGKREEAIDCHRQALRLKPDFVEAYLNLGLALHDRGNFEEAIVNYRHVLALRPGLPAVYNNLGNALRNLGRLDEAVANYQHALRLKLDYAEAHNNLGAALTALGRLDEAVAAFERALAIQPDRADLHNNLGIALKERGEVEQALAITRKAVLLKPGNARFHSNLVYDCHYHPDYDSAALFAEARRWSERHAEPLANRQVRHSNDTNPGRRLRVGYVSPDFRSHPAACLMMPLFSNHDRRELEIFCYAEVMNPDDVTARLRPHADVWRSTVGITDEHMASMVREDGIDILVDLALHTGNNRLTVFARKPAPVQVTWLGYPGTTGLSAIDYRLTDPYFDPPEFGDAGRHAEESIRLPDTYWCYSPGEYELSVGALPALQNGYVTFGCMNNFCKINNRLLSLWAMLMRLVPQSRLILHVPQGSRWAHVGAVFQQDGIDPARLDLVGKTPKIDYLRTYDRIDLCLDPWPCNGGVTSLDALWMGVPIVTLVGMTTVGRAGWSLLSNLGLPELAAQTPDEYITIAAQLTGDLPRLQKLRAGMRARLRTSPLMDGPRFARNIEQAYRRMWHRWCRLQNG